MPQVLYLGPGLAPLDTRNGPPPLGSVLACDLGGRADALAVLLREHRRFLWCPACVVLRRLDSTVLTVFEPPGGWAIVRVSGEESSPVPAEIVAAVRRRPAPTPSVVMGWAAERLNQPQLPGSIARCMVESGVNSDLRLASERTLRRWTSALGVPPVPTWRAVARLITIFRQPPTGATVERLALDAGLDPRTLRRWLDRILGCTLDEAIARPGWEWMVEAMLRRAGCLHVPESASARPPERRPSGPFARA